MSAPDDKVYAVLRDGQVHEIHEKSYLAAEAMMELYDGKHLHEVVVLCRGTAEEAKRTGRRIR